MNAYILSVCQGKRHRTLSWAEHESHLIHAKDALAALCILSKKLSWRSLDDLGLDPHGHPFPRSVAGYLRYLDYGDISVHIYRISPDLQSMEPVCRDSVGGTVSQD